MTPHDALARYKSLVDKTEEIDRWVFSCDASLGQDFIAERKMRMQPVLDNALRLIADLMPHCAKDIESNDTKSALDVAGRVKTLIDVESTLSAYLVDASKEPDVIKLNTETPFKTYYSSTFRTYRYLVWRKRAFVATTDIAQNGIAAVLRVKNELANMQMMLPVLLSYFDEIIVVDHNSTDGTYEFVSGLPSSKIQTFRYTTETARAGEFYAFERQNGKGSLAEYYNFAFSKAQSAYLCKWDADMYPLPTLRSLLDSVRSGVCDVVSFNGLDCYGY